MAKARAASAASSWLSIAAVLIALGLVAASTHHLLADSRAWVTPFHAAVSLGLAALALASLPAVAGDVTWLRIAIPIAVLGANVGFIVAHLAGHRLVSFAAYPSPMFAVLLATATTLGAIGLVRRQMWARWLFLALGAAALGSGGLNAIRFWSVTAEVDPRQLAWSHLLIEQAWGFLASTVAGLLIVANLATAGGAFVAGRSHAAWTSDATVVRTLRWLTIAALVAVPMLLVYAWIQPIVDATRPTALALAAALTVGVTAAVRGRLIGVVIVCLGGLGLCAQTVATYLLASPRDHNVALYYAVFWLPAAALAVVAGAQLAGPIARLLRR